MNKIINLEMQMSKVQEQTGHNAARLTVVEMEINTMYSSVTAAGSLAPAGNTLRPDRAKSPAVSVSRRATPYLTGEEQLPLARGQPLNGESDGFPLLSSGKSSLNASGSHNHSVATADAAPPASSERSAAASAATIESDGDHQS